jgi:hypothetical protein
LGNAIGASLGAMRGAEGVVHEDIAKRSHLPCQYFVVLLFALV